MKNINQATKLKNDDHDKKDSSAVVVQSSPVSVAAYDYNKHEPAEGQALIDPNTPSDESNAALNAGFDVELASVITPGSLIDKKRHDADVDESNVGKYKRDRTNTNEEIEHKNADDKSRDSKRITPNAISQDEENTTEEMYVQYLPKQIGGEELSENIDNTSDGELSEMIINPDEDKEENDMDLEQQARPI